MHRFFVEGVRARGDEVELAGADARKARAVLRLRDGDRIEIADSGSQAFVAVIAVRGERVFATLAERLAVARGESVLVDVAQAIPKGQKMDFAIEKMTELGVSRILPFVSERSVARDPAGARVERWRRLARSASLQCGRRDVPEIAEPAGFEAIVDRFAEYGRVLFAWELAPDRPLRETLPKLLGVERVLAVIGPEGGFSHDEAERAVRAGATPLRLGRRILRTETAGLALLAVLDYASEPAPNTALPELGTTAS